MRRKLLLPLVFGSALGLIQGSWDFQSSLGYTEYMRCGMYSTIAKALVARVDYPVAVASAVFYSLMFVVLAQRRIKGVARKAFLSTAAIGYAILLGWVSLGSDARLGFVLNRYRHDLAGGVLRDAVATGTHQIAASAAVIVLGVMLLRRLRRHDIGRHDHLIAEPFAKGWRLMSAGFPMIERQRACMAIILGVLVLIHLTAACVIVRNTLALRHSPNIVFIMVDTLRADHLGCYGYYRDTTPNIDKLAAGSLRFNKVISQAPWTTASIGSFMSGRYQRISLYSNEAMGSVDTPLLSEVLRDRGYFTTATVSNVLAEQLDLDRGYDKYTKINVPYVSSPEVLKSALSSLARCGKSKFFMFLLFLDPHVAYVQHDEYNYDPGYKGGLGKVIEPQQLDEISHSPDDVEHAKSLYDSEIRFTDEHIGKFLAALKKRNLYDDTLIVFLADHGEGFAEHGKMSHGITLYDELLSVPLIIKLPGQKKGSVVKGTTALLDLFPSIMNYLHYDVAKMGLPGRALGLDGLKSVRPTAIYSSTDFADVRLSCIRTGNRKYIYDRNTHRDQLFDLATDRGEYDNLASRYPFEAASLRKLVQQKDREMDASAHQLSPNAKPSSLSDQEKQQLHSLGYL